MTQAAILDELTDRLPGLNDAIDAWIDDEDSPFETIIDALARL